MLNFWRSHADYQAFVSDTVSIFSENEILKLQSYSKSREKLASLNLDAVGVLWLLITPILADLLKTSLKSFVPLFL